ncbi:hypothetical protein [uncultured Roseibium sp.]|uniref:hypothetical protein n=1 Tax=uncultured Roseibium sp. TaxID=1936171 RepID=UPI0032170659
MNNEKENSTTGRDTVTRSKIILCPGYLHLKPIVIRTEVVEQTNHHYLRQKGTVRGRPTEEPEKVMITLPRVDALKKLTEGI